MFRSTRSVIIRVRQESHGGYCDNGELPTLLRPKRSSTRLVRAALPGTAQEENPDATLTDSSAQQSLFKPRSAHDSLAEEYEPQSRSPQMLFRTGAVVSW